MINETKSLKKLIKGFAILIFAITMLFGMSLLSNPIEKSVSATMGSEGTTLHDEDFLSTHNRGTALRMSHFIGGNLLANDDYYLNNDLTLTRNVNININVSLCLNGYTLNCGSYHINVEGNVSILDCSAEATGKIVGSSGYVIQVDEDATLNIYGGTIENTSESSIDKAISNFGNLVLDGGTITNLNGQGVYQKETPSFIMNSGAINAKVGVYNYVNVATATINGGTITTTSMAIDQYSTDVDENSLIKITGGEFRCSTYMTIKGLWEISGGTFQIDSEYDLLIAESGTLHLSGAPYIVTIKVNTVSSDLSTTPAQIVATGYTGQPIILTYSGVFKSDVGKYIVSGVDSSNAVKFTAPDNSGCSFQYDAEKSALKIVRRTYAITYNAGSSTGGTLPEPGLKTDDTNYAVAAASLTKTGCTHVGWSTSAENFVGANMTSIITANQATTLYPVWLEHHNLTVTLNNLTHDGDAGQFSITYTRDYGEIRLVPDDGYELPSTITVKRGTGESETTLVQGTDYTYSTSSGYIGLEGDSITDDIYITANGVVVTYTIAYDVNGGNALTADQILGKTTYTVNTANFDLPIPTRTNYDFVGWFAKQQLPIAESDPNLYDFYSGSDVYDWLQANPEMPEESLPLYSSLDNENLTTENNFETHICSEAVVYLTDFTYIAKWVEKTYSVTYNSNGATSGSAPIDATLYHNSESVEIGSQGDLLKDGCVFAGYNTNQNAVVGLTSYVMGMQNVTFYAIWLELSPTRSIANGTINFKTEDENKYFKQGDGEWTQYFDTFTITGESISNDDVYNYVVVESGTHNITLDNVHIGAGNRDTNTNNATGDKSYATTVSESPFSISATAIVNLTLVGENYLISANHIKAGLRVVENATLNIVGTGSLEATSCKISAPKDYAKAAGIGGNFDEKAGSISITDASVKTFSLNGPGIGGGYTTDNCLTASSLTINSGTVEITTSNLSTIAAYVDNIVINGGVVRCGTSSNIKYSTFNTVPKNSSGQDVYCAKLALASANIDVSSLIFQDSNKDNITYDLTGSKSISGGAVYVYLPSGIALTEYDSVYYYANVTNSNTAEFSPINVYFSINDTECGSVDFEGALNVPYGTVGRIDGNKITFGDTTVTATANTAPETSNYYYKFNGWGISNNTTITGSKMIPVNFSSVLKTYTITYDTNGGHSVDNKNYTALTADFDLPSTTRIAYDFIGWFGAKVIADTTYYFGLDYLTTTDESLLYTDLNNENLTTSNSITHIDCSEFRQSASFIAKWTIITYSITYTNAVNGEANVTNSNATTYTFEDETITLADPTKTGYTFNGWTTSEITTPTKGLTIPHNSYTNKTFVANWTLNTYSITYTNSVNGEEDVVNSNATSYTFEDETITLADPTKTGYTFNGWTTSEVTTPTKGLTIAHNSMGNKTIVANWTVNEYELKIYYYGSINSVFENLDTYSCMYDYGESFSVANPTFTGYTIRSQYSSTVTGTMDSIYGKTFQIFYDINKYALNLDFSHILNQQVDEDNFSTYLTHGREAWCDILSTFGYDLPDSVTLTRGDDVLVEDTHYTYTINNEVGRLVIFASVITGPITYTVQGVLIECDVVYDVNGGNELTAAQLENKDIVSVEKEDFELPIPTRTGYTFDGWFIKYEIYDSLYYLSQEYCDYCLEPDGEPTFYFGSDLSNAELDIDNSIVIIDCELCVDLIGHSEYDYIVIVAKWKLDEYTITYTNAVDGEDNVSNSNDTSYTFEDETITLADPTKTGYTFNGWTTSEVTTPTKGLTIAHNSMGNKTFVANWTVITYTISFNDNDENAETNVENTTYTIESETITLPTLSARFAYTCVGWFGYFGNPAKYFGTDFTANPANIYDELNNANLSSANAFVNIPSSTCSNLTFIAKWLAKPEVSITLDMQGGTGGTEQINTYKDEVMPSATAPSYDGHEFLGYYSNNDGTGIQYYNASMVAMNNWTSEATTGTLYAHYRDWRVIYVSDAEFDGDGTELNPFNDFSKALYRFTSYCENVGGTIVVDGNVIHNNYINVTSNAGQQRSLTLTSKNGTANLTLFGIYVAANSSLKIESLNLIGSNNSVDAIVCYANANTLELVNVSFNNFHNVIMLDGKLVNPIKIDNLKATNIENYYAIYDYTTRNRQVTLCNKLIMSGVIDLDNVCIDITQTVTVPEGKTLSAPAGQVIQFNKDSDKVKERMLVDGYVWIENCSQMVFFNSLWNGNDTFAFIAEEKTDGSGIFDIVARKQASVSYDLNYSTEETIAAAKVLHGYKYISVIGEEGIYANNVLSATPSLRPHYEFLGWSLTEDGQVLNADSEVTLTNIDNTTSANFTVYAIWETIEYDITYDLDGGTNNASNPASYNIESSTITLVDPTKTGYTFNGWTTTEVTTPTKGLTIAHNSTGNKTFVANWTLNTYSITYTNAVNGEDNVSNSNDTTYTFEDETIALADPTKTGYTFNGWTTTEITTPTKGLTIAHNSTEDKTFVANWTLNTYSITYTNAVNGEDNVSNSNDTTYTFEDETITLADPTKTGYTFNGWTTTEVTTPTKNLTIAHNSTGNKTFVANWTLNRYTITWRNGDQTVELDENVAHGTMPTYDGTTPTKTSSDATYRWDFKAWSPAITNAIENTTYTATFEKILLVITTPEIDPSNPDDADRIEAEIDIADGAEDNLEFVVKVKKLREMNENIVAPKGQEIVKSYNAQLLKNNVEFTSYTGTMTIKIATPVEMKNRKDVQVIIMDKTTGAAVTKTIIVDGDYLTFETNSLGDFAIVANKINNSTLLWIILAVLIAGLVVLCLLWIFNFKSKITFILNGSKIGIAKYKRGETLNFPLNLARYKWFTDKAETKLFAKQKMGWFGFTLYRNSESAPNYNSINSNNTKNKKVKKKIKK